MYEVLTLPYNSSVQYNSLDNDEPRKSWPLSTPWSNESPEVDSLSILDGFTGFDQDATMRSSSSSDDGKPSAMMPSKFCEKTKKIDHNVKEKLRRMKLNDSYFALLLLLPDSKKTKRKWSAPMLIDRALEYIPELQKEVETLMERRDSILLLSEKKNIETQNPTLLPQGLTISITEANKGELIVQICLDKDQRADILSTLLENLEHEGASVATISALLICVNRLCIQLHLHIKKSINTSNYMGILKEKIVLWLSETNTSNFSISTDAQTSTYSMHVDFELPQTISGHKM